MIAICPKPQNWHEIHQRLHQAALLAQPPIAPPPVPLILGGWTGSNDIEKQNRWNETLAWADQHGLTDLIGDLPPLAMYRVVSPCIRAPDEFESP